DGTKCTRRLSRARPDIRRVAASLRPSPSATRTSTTVPSCFSFSSVEISSMSATSRSYRSWTTSRGTWPSMVAAGVPARIEYWKVNADANRAIDLAAGAQQLAERQPVAELGPVGVHVLAEQRDLDDALIDELADF